jgi:squalene cyclase
MTVAIMEVKQVAATSSTSTRGSLRSGSTNRMLPSLKVELVKVAPAGLTPELIVNLSEYVCIVTHRAIDDVELMQSINQSINVTIIAIKFIEDSCQPFTRNCLFD